MPKTAAMMVSTAPLMNSFTTKNTTERTTAAPGMERMAGIIWVEERGCDRCAKSCGRNPLVARPEHRHRCHFTHSPTAPRRAISPSALLLPYSGVW